MRTYKEQAQPARGVESALCNLYSMTKGQQAIRDFVRATRDTTGNLPPLPGIFPDGCAPVVFNAPDGERGTHGPLASQPIGSSWE